MIHNNMNVLSKKVIVLLSIITLASCADLKAMKRARENDAIENVHPQEKKQKIEPSVELGENEFFVYSTEESDKSEKSGIKISLETLMLSKTMFNIREDFGGFFPEKSIPLNYSKAAIEQLFKLLQEDIELKNSHKIIQLDLYKTYLSAIQLPLFIEVINLATYLDIPSDKLQLCIEVAVDRIDDIKLDENYPNDDLEKINPDLRNKIIPILLKKADKSLGSLLLDKKPTINRGQKNALFNAAGNKIIYLAGDNELVAHDVELEKHEECHLLQQFNDSPLLIQRSELSDKIIVDTIDSQVEIFDLKHMDREFFPISMQHDWSSTSSVISSSGKWLAILYRGSVCLWEVRHGDNGIVLQDKKEKKSDFITSISFSSCDKYIITGTSVPKAIRISSDKANIIKWDISDINNISREPVIGYEDYSTVQIKWTLDGKKIIVGFNEPKNNLMVLEVKDNTFIPHILSRCIDEKGNIGPGHAESIKSIQVSADSKRFVSSSMGLQDNLFVWDISDLSNIKRAKLSFKETVGSISNIAINPQGNILLFDYNRSSPCLSYVRDREKMKLLYINSFDSIKKYNIKGSSFDGFSMNAQGNFTMYARDKTIPAIQQGLLFSEDDHTMLKRLNTGNLKDAKLIADLYIIRKANERDLKTKQEEFMKARWKSNYIAPTMESIILSSDSPEKKAFNALPSHVKGLLKDNWKIEEK